MVVKFEENSFDLDFIKKCKDTLEKVIKEKFQVPDDFAIDSLEFIVDQDTGYFNILPVSKNTVIICENLFSPDFIDKEYATAILKRGYHLAVIDIMVDEEVDFMISMGSKLILPSDYNIFYFNSK